MDHKAFVSSTFLDLKEHRRHVIQKLRSAGITVDPMEDWVAADDAPKKLSLNRIKGCDLCVLLVAFRRGYIPEGEVKSITQLEYEYARKNGIHVLVFLLEDKTPWPREYDDWETDPKIQAWRNELRRDHAVSEFGLDPISVQVLEPVTRWYSSREDYQKTSWPKGVDMWLVTQSFFESTFPAYILDASGYVIGWNSSFMTLVGQHDGPEKGQHVEDWITSKGHEMAILSAAGNSRTVVSHMEVLKPLSLPDRGNLESLEA